MAQDTLSDLQSMPLDTKTIPQDRLNIDSKERRNLFPWNGQFSPQLVEVLLGTYANSRTVVLDPFLGSGTVLCEAGRCNLPAFGAEINPAAYKMASIYRFINKNPSKRRHAIETMDELVSDLTPDVAPLFSSSRAHISRPLHLSLADYVHEEIDPDVRRLLEALIVRVNAGEKELDQWTLNTTWARLREVVAGLPYSKARIELANCDARTLPIRGGHADLVITSPPYINVFNYHQHYRKSVELLGWDLLEVAKSEIGSNRKHRGNRFLTVTQYCLDMVTVLEELRRVCKPGAQIIIVVGRESNVRKTRFLNGEIVAGLAVRSLGFRFSARQERVFKNRFGEMIYEDILHFAPQPTSGQSVTPPREVARGFLNAALAWVPAESVEDLRDALERIDEVTPSPLYCQSPPASYPRGGLEVSAFKDSRLVQLDLRREHVVQVSNDPLEGR